MISRTTVSVLILNLLCGSAAWSAGEERLEIQNLPPEPEPTEEPLEPEVTIIQQEGRIIEEYRIDGQLRAVRIIPTQGRPYYLIDSDGDGILDQRRFTLADDILIPGWVVHSW